MAVGRNVIAYGIALATLVLAPLAPVAEAAPKRVIALSPFTANTVASLGLKPVGMGQVLGGRDRLTGRLKGVPQLPLSHPNGPNMEQLARLKPDLVLSSPAWNRGHGAMRRLGADVVESEPTSVAQVAAQTTRIGRLLGREKQAAKVARRQQQRIAAAQRGITRRPTVLVVLGVGRTPYAFLPSSWGGDVVAKAGGKLLTEGLNAGSGGYARISDEVVVARDPDIIIAVPHGNVKDIPRMAQFLKTNPAWQTTKAVKNGRLYVSTGNSLLQPWTDVDRVIRDVRRRFLKN